MNIKPGDLLSDNNSKRNGRELKIIEVLPNGVAAQDCWGMVRLYLMKSIHTDGKLRKSGFSLIPQKSEQLRLLIFARTIISNPTMNSELSRIWLHQADAEIGRATGSS